ncbi:INO80 complex subunit [Lachnellula hyalina]|uniref:INO80 complex subunit n=1 Tax=Lachnellula hyalina TaxID=1316788 RepID=A0A8H8R120_9HELO|nr:INO80 complex subunit [Lachnellula hyalina]TVY25805.1 INO80 complex subunit [Lachnellula hyalina]
MADESPVGSPLSDLSSDAFEGEGEEEHEQLAEAHMPPAKRQKLGDASLRGTPASHPVEGSISSDTDGEIPQSPVHGVPLPDDDIHEQVTVCAWDGCDAGDMNDMDRLVEHIHNEHIETRQKKYTCEWGDCTRKSLPHASGYALKAHMRSHTREKPFYCALPECDRAFTRSDALAKHMRTVHETEALRPSDPVPKYLNPQHNKSRLKLLVKKDHGTAAAEAAPIPVTNGTTNGSPHHFVGWTSSYPLELGFTPDEEERGAEQLFQLLRRQIHWAQEETVALKEQTEAYEQLRRKEWAEKEVLLDQVINNEYSYHERRQRVLASAAKIPTADEFRAAAAQAAYSPTREAVPQSPVPLNGQALEDAEAATALASMSNV